MSGANTRNGKKKYPTIKLGIFFVLLCYNTGVVNTYIISSQDEKPIRNSKNSQKNSFVQENGRFHCKDAGLHFHISEQQGHTCCCRNPRCSFECQQNHGKKESLIVISYANTCFFKKCWFRGCLKLPPQATQDDHDRSFDYFNDLLRSKSKEQKLTIKFRGRYHATAGNDKHLDYIGWSDQKDIKMIQQIWYECAKRAGFVVYPCRPLQTRQQLAGWCDYMFRRYCNPKKTKEFLYLLADDGSHIIRGSHKFFDGTTYDKIWQEIKDKWASNITISNKTTFDQNPPGNIFEIKARDVPIEDKILAILPQLPHEAISIGRLLWLIRVDEDVLMPIIMNNPDIHWHNLRVWYDSPDPSPQTWEDRLFGTCGIPYHYKWFPIPKDEESELQKIVKSYDPKDYEITEDMDFYDELMSM